MSRPVEAMNEALLDRYSRHILYDRIGIAGQEALRAAELALVGCGGLGCAAALYLAAAGVGRLHLIDADHVERSNLQRQPGHDSQRLGWNKALSLATTLRAINPDCEVVVHPYVFSHWADSAGRTAPTALILDCTDHFAVRDQINTHALARGIPVVYAAALAGSGQASVFHPADPQSACLRCLLPEAPGREARSCAEQGVVGPLVGMLGSWQAIEALKLITACAAPARGLWLYDLFTGWHHFALPRRPDCPACGPHAQRA